MPSRAPVLQVGIVADDLTGAADCIAPLAAAGLPSEVVLLEAGAPASSPSCSALAVDAGLRGLSPDQGDVIRQRLQAAFSLVTGRQPRHVLLKIDSTLRGPLPSMLASVRELLPGRLLVVCPAFPAQGRTVREGILSVSQAGRMTRMDVREVLGVPTAPLLSLARLRTGHEAVGAWLAAHHDAVICDAETDGDLRILARATLSAPGQSLLVGSSGLARGLASLLAADPPPEDAPPLPRPTLVVVGSRQEASRRQVQHLAMRLGLDPVMVEAHAVTPIHQATAQLESGPRVALLCAPETTPTARSHVAAALAQATSHVLASTRAHLLVTGGDTAWHVLRGLGIARLRVEGEVEPGLPAARVQGGGWDFRMLTKAGGFGDEEVLARCLGLSTSTIRLPR